LWTIFEFAELTINQRQVQNDVLAGICSRLRTGSNTLEDMDSLMTRHFDNVSEHERRSFIEAIHIFPTCKQVV